MTTAADIEEALLGLPPAERWRVMKELTGQTLPRLRYETAQEALLQSGKPHARNTRVAAAALLGEKLENFANILTRGKKQWGTQRPA